MDNPVDNLWILLGEDICLSQLGVKRLNKYIFLLCITVTVTLKLPHFLWLAACS